MRFCNLYFDNINSAYLNKYQPFDIDVSVNSRTSFCSRNVTTRPRQSISTDRMNQHQLHGDRVRMLIRSNCNGLLLSMTGGHVVPIRWWLGHTHGSQKVTQLEGHDMSWCSRCSMSACRQMIEFCISLCYNLPTQPNQDYGDAAIAVFAEYLDYCKCPVSSCNESTHSAVKKDMK